MEESILINGQDVPVLSSEGLPLVTYKGHHGQVATLEECIDELMFDGLTFWCPIEFLRISEGDENVRKTPLSEDEIDRYVSMVNELGDVGTLIVTEDTKGKNKLRILDGNNRFPIFVRECNPTHVFVKYVDTISKLEEMKVQSIANTHTQTTHESEAFKALEAKTLTDDLPKNQRDSELSFFYAEIAKGNRGKVEFTKRWKRAKYAIAAVWQALSEGKITVEVIDHLATLINLDTEEILADLQQEILDSAIANNLKVSQVQTKCAAAFANWEQSQQVVEEDEDESFEFSYQPKYGCRTTATIFRRGSVWQASNFFDDEEEEDEVRVPRLMDKNGGWHRKDKIEEGYHRQSDFNFASSEAIISTIKEVYEVDSHEEEFDLAPSSAPSRPTSAIAPKTPVPSTPKPPVEKVTAAAVVKQKQEVKATKGTGGKKANAAKTTASPKVTTNAPASIPNAIAANPNVHVAVIGRDEPKPKVDVNIYQELLDIEDGLVKKSVVLPNGSGITQDAWDRLGKEAIADIDNILAQVQVLRVFLTKIEEAASAVQMDLKDQ